MSYRIKYRGLDIVVDTIKDIDALADHLEARRLAQAPSSPAQSPESSLAELVRTSTSKQNQFLRFLVDRSEEDAPTDEELRVALGLRDNNQIAGLTSALSKRLKGLGLDTILVLKDIRFSQGLRNYRYWIPESLREELREALYTTTTSVASTEDDDIDH